MDVDTQADKTDTEDEVDAPVFRYGGEFRFFEMPKVVEKIHVFSPPAAATTLLLRVP